MKGRTERQTPGPGDTRARICDSGVGERAGEREGPSIAANLPAEVLILIMSWLVLDAQKMLE
eukprot:2451949-Rhodomonas_salina.1